MIYVLLTVIFLLLYLINYTALAAYILNKPLLFFDQINLHARPGRLRFKNDPPDLGCQSSHRDQLCELRLDVRSS